MIGDTEKNGSEIMVSRRSYSYQADGRQEISNFDGDNKLKSKTIQFFDQGRQMREQVLNDRDEPQSTAEYQYNAAGQKILWSIQGKGAAPTTSEYVWTNGQLSLITVFDSARHPIKKYQRSYSPDGNIITEQELDAKDSLIRRTISTWAAGRLIKEEVRTAQDAVQKTSLYSYDAKGQLVKTELFNRKGDLSEIQNRIWIDLIVTIPAK